MNSSKSRYTIVIDRLSEITRSKDIKWECERFGRVLAVERDARARCALVEFKSSRDAEDAWRKLDGIRVDGARWEVNWATRKDYGFFGWKWNEPSPSPSRSPSRRSRSPSPSRSKSPASKDDKADIAP